MTLVPQPADPTSSVDLDFDGYVRRRKEQQSARMASGVPDYAFSLDSKLRAQLAAIGPLRTIGQALNAATVPIQRQLMQMDGVAVGPRQFPEIYAMGEECARRLGIGIPQIFVISDPMPNAWTYCTNDVDQLIVMTSGLAQSCKPLELKFVIAHECGHIHNQHVIYNTIWEMLTNPLASAMLNSVAGTLSLGLYNLVRSVVQISLWYLFSRWHRCAEFTCDRAGLICCGDRSVAQQALGKLVTMGAQGLEGFNADEYARQMKQIDASPLRFMEILRSHPLGPKRVEALRLFGESAMLYHWRPDLRTERALREHAAIDAECEKLVI